MIYLLYGTDNKKGRKKLHELIESLLRKKPDASHIRMTDEDFDASKLEEFVSSMGLFSNRAIVELDQIFNSKEAKETVLEKLKELAASENIFVFLEGELNKKELNAFEKSAEKIQEFDTKKDKGRIFMTDTGGKFSLKDFNIFSLADALGRCDKKQLWVLYAKASKKGISAEEIHGLLSWQIRAILQARSAKSATNAGLNPYVFQKSIGFARNYKEGELESTSMKLVSMYHDARRGIVDFDSALEEFILKL